MSNQIEISTEKDVKFCQIILLVCRRFTLKSWGGTESAVLSQARELKRRGFSPVIVTSTALDAKRDEIIQGIQIIRFPYFYQEIPLSREIKKQYDFAGGNLFSWSLLLFIFKQKNVFVIHLNMTGRLSAAISLLAKLKRIPVFLTIHGGVYDRPALCDVRGQEGISFEWGKVIGWCIDSRNFVKRISKVYCFSEKEKQGFSENYSMPLEKIEHAIDLCAEDVEKGFRQEFKIPENKFLVLCVANIYPQKNQLSIIIGLIRKIKSGECHVAFIGHVFDMKYVNEIKEFISTEKIENHITWVGGVEPSDKKLQQAYNECDVFILPSYYEVFGIVVLEAWRWKKPVIVSKRGGLAEFITEHENGIFADPENPETIRMAVDALMSSLELCTRLGENGHSVLSDKYSIEKRTNSYLQDYEESFLKLNTSGMGSKQ